MWSLNIHKYITGAVLTGSNVLFTVVATNALPPAS